MSDETIKINQCPICESSHSYNLKVERTIFVKLMTASDMSERPQKKKFTRIFICPKTMNQFQATFFLTETSSDRIIGVSVDNSN